MMDDRPEVIYIKTVNPFVSDFLAAISPLNGKKSSGGCISESSDAIEYEGMIVLVPHVKMILQSYERDSLVIISTGENNLYYPGTSTKEGGTIMRGLYFQEKNIMTGEVNSRQFLAYRAATGHIARLMVGIAPQPIKQPSKFILAAISKDKFRPQLARHYGNMSTDGFRLHYDQSLPPAPDFYRLELYGRMMELLDGARVGESARVELTPAAVKELIRACKVAKKYKASIKLSVNGVLDYNIADYPAVINGRISQGYTHTGDDITILFNPSQLLDALEPINTVILLKDKDHAAYITAGSHEAVIMPRQLKD
jgi:hypothetical protein